MRNSVFGGDIIRYLTRHVAKIVMRGTGGLMPSMRATTAAAATTTSSSNSAYVICHSREMTYMLPLVMMVPREYDRCHVTYARATTATSGSMYFVTCFDSCHVTSVTKGVT